MTSGPGVEQTTGLAMLTEMGILEKEQVLGKMEIKNSALEML